MRIYIDDEALVPDGAVMRKNPTLLLHGGPGFDHISLKPFFFTVLGYCLGCVSGSPRYG